MSIRCGACNIPKNRAPQQGVKLDSVGAWVCSEYCRRIWTMHGPPGPWAL